MRRSMSQREVLRMVRNNWHRNAPFTESICSTAGFLWLLVVVMIFGSCVFGMMAGWPQAEHHADHRANAVVDRPGVQRDETRAGGEGQDVGHAAQPGLAPEVRP